MTNTGQMLLILGALVLFSLLLPSINHSLLYNDRTLIATNAELAAISLAEKILGEAGTISFDEVCLTSRPETAGKLTKCAKLGPEGGEKYPNFDDLDDFHGVTISDSLTLPSVLFNIRGTVTYVDPLDPENDVSYPTFVKRLQVDITGPYLVNPASEDAVQISIEQLYAFY